MFTSEAVMEVGLAKQYSMIASLVNLDISLRNALLSSPRAWQSGRPLRLVSISSDSRSVERANSPWSKCYYANAVAGLHVTLSRYGNAETTRGNSLVQLAC